MRVNAHTQHQEPLSASHAQKVPPSSTKLQLRGSDVSDAECRGEDKHVFGERDQGNQLIKVVAKTKRWKPYFEDLIELLRRQEKQHENEIDSCGSAARWGTTGGNGSGRPPGTDLGRVFNV